LEPAQEVTLDIGATISQQTTMFPTKPILQVFRQECTRPRLVAAALAASGIIAWSRFSENTANGAEQDMEASSQKQRAIQQLVAFDSFIHPFIFPVSTTRCEFIRGPTFSRLARSRTIRRIEDSSTKATLKSRYDVQWKSPLGEGGFGAVYLATDRKTNERVAVKQIAKTFTDNASFQREMNAFLHIRRNGSHPNICGLIENFDEGKYYYIVLDLISGGEMFDHLINNGAFSEADAARMFREIGSALAFLHGINIVHGDLKPENLMLSSKNQTDAVIELVDFGCAQIIDETSPFYEESLLISATTPGYSPPEMVDKSLKLTHLAPSMDMFSIGVILYVMLCGCHPYDVDGTASDEELNKRILARKLPELRNSRNTAHLSRSAVELMEKLMHPDPKKRLTAQQMLDHPWVRGETAAKGKIKGSDQRLKKFRKYKSQLEANVFQNMVRFSGDLATPDIHKKTSLIEQSFRALDPENKGYITTRQLKELDPKTNTDNADDDTQLSLSGFSDLLSDNMKNRYFPSGHVIYREGDRGKSMYFINSGRIEVSSKDGFKASIETGDFFGEGALLSKSGRRSASIKTLTPVHAIEISKEYFDKYLASGYDTQINLRERDKERKRNRAKTILASTKTMEEQWYPKGSSLYEQGRPGDDVFILEEGEVDVTIEDHTVYAVKPGELCGESAVIFGKPRNTAAKCVSDKCLVHILKGEDFTKIVNSMASSTLKESLRDITHRREFQKALVFTTKKAFPTTEAELREAFEETDYDRSGKIDLADITLMLKQIDATWTNKEIKEILASLDLDRTGAVNWEAFKRMFCTSNSNSNK
jgi:serine/threonine protein kinase/Ca2+-binding EF-hand superfamily protein